MGWGRSTQPGLVHVSDVPTGLQCLGLAGWQTSVSVRCWLGLLLCLGPLSLPQVCLHGVFMVALFPSGNSRCYRACWGLCSEHDHHHVLLHTPWFPGQEEVDPTAEGVDIGRLYSSGTISNNLPQGHHRDIGSVCF